MKRFLSIILTLVMLVSSMSNILVFASDVSTTLETGDTVVLYAFLSDNPGVSELVLSFEYDSSAMNLVKVTNGEAMGDATYTGPKNLASGCMATWYYIDEPDYFKDGSLVALEFEIVDSEAMGNTYPLSVVIVSAEGANGTVFDLQNNIRVIDYRPGDVNGDGIHSLRYDVSEFNQYIVDGCKYDPLGYAVQINENAADVNNDGVITIKDVIDVNKYIVDGGVYDPNGYAVKLYPHIEVCKHTSLTAVPAKEATCTENGNIEYWICDDCGKYFEDEAATKEIYDVVSEKTGHVPDDVKVCFCTYCGEELNTGNEHIYSKAWSNDLKYHWHATTCGHDLMIDKAVHNFDIYNECSVCGIQKNKLPAPVITNVEQSVIYWNPVEGVESYQVSATFDEVVYTCEVLNEACPISALKDTKGNSIDKYGEVSKIKVRANATSQYKESEWSDYVGTYYYVPESVPSEKFESVGLGYGYDLIQSAPYNASEKKNAVFNLGKLSSAYSGFELSTPAYSDYYSYSSVDEYISNRSAKMEANLDVKVPVVGGLKTKISMNASNNSKTYEYNENFVLEVVQEFYEHRVDFQDIGDYALVNNYLEDCLSSNFVDTIKGKTSATDGKSDAEIAAIIYGDFGTHAVMAVNEGSSYFAQYVLSTNSKDVAEKTKMQFDLEGNVNIGAYFDMNTSLGLESESENSWSNSETKTHLYATWTGSTGGVAVSQSQLEDAVKSWEQGINPVPEKFAKNGVIPIRDLINLIDENVAKAYDKLINDLSDDSYEELCKLYGVDLESRLIQPPSNGVLTVDLSAYSTLAYAYDPCLRESEFTIHPTVYGQYIDTIVFKSDFDEAYERELLDSFSLIVPETWNGRNLNIIFRNFGAVCDSKHGIVDTSALSNTNKVSVTYEGINLFKETEKEYLYAVDGELYRLNIGDGAFNLNNLSGSCLSNVEKAQYDFGGWYYFDNEGKETYVTDAYGNITDSVNLDVSVPTLYAGWTPRVYMLTFDEQGATASGTTSMYVMYGIAFTYDMNNGNENAKDYALANSVLKIETIPEKTGYWFGGYYTEPDGKGVLCVDKDGNIIVTNMFFESGTTLFAYWLPSEYTVIYDKNAEDAVGEQMSSKHTFNVPSNLTATEYTRTGFSFAGWNTKPDGSGDYYSDEQEIKNLATKHNSVVTLYAVWTQNTVVTLSHEDAENKNGLLMHLYMPKNEDGTYSGIYFDVNCENEVDRVTIPAKTGYTFEGYYYDGVEYIDENGNILPKVKEVESGITLTASWMEHQYRVVFNANGGTGTMPAIESINYSDVFDLPELGFKRTSHRFAGWKCSANGKTYNDKQSGLQSLTATDGATVTFTAQWEIIQYTVTYNLNTTNDYNYQSTQCYEDVTFSPQSKTITYEKTGQSLDVPKVKYYKFLGWYTADKNEQFTDESGNLLNASAEPKDRTLYAKWSKSESYTDYTYIKTPSDFSKIRSNLAGKYLLIKSINIGAISPLDNFSGVLDGGGNTISGWSDVQDSVGNFGLISVNSGTVKNLVISGFKITTSDPDVSGKLKIGLLCAENTGTIQNVKVSSGTIVADVASISHSADSYIYAGIVCGYNKGKITSCTISGAAIDSYVGCATDYHSYAYCGIVAGFSESGTITSCTTSGNTIETEAKADVSRGFLGIEGGHGAPRAYSGGIVGKATNGSISSSTSTSDAIVTIVQRNCGCTSNVDCRTGGIVGYYEGTSVTSNTVSGGTRTATYLDNGNAVSMDCVKAGTTSGN